MISPLFNPQILAQIDANAQLFQDLHGKLYLPGYCGLNNVKANDYINVVVQGLAHILPLRNSFLLNSSSSSASGSASSSSGNKGELSAAWTELLRKLWNPLRFKAQNSPHEFLQIVSQVSAKRFSLTAQADPSDFMTWFLNALEAENAGLLSEILRGSVRVESAQLNREGAVISAAAEEKSFLHLSLDLPARPLFSDPKAPGAVPQVSLSVLLGKFDGGTPVYKQNAAITYRLARLPPFLVLCVARRVKGRFGVEWNDTLVRFNAEEAIEMPGHPEVKYRLMANIYGRRSGDGEQAKAKSFGVHLRHRASGKWLEMENLQVKETESQLLFMAESLIQFWERV